MAKQHQTAGWIILDKPTGLFSRTAGMRVARLFGQKKFGHIGTLDQLASGVLPIAIGDATKMIPFLEDAPGAMTKEYLFSVRFGIETDTLDIMGRRLLRRGTVPDLAHVRNVLPKLTGDIMQTPPAYSAIHVRGARAYDLARRGEDVEIEPRRVHISLLEYVGRNDASWEFRVRCTRGTYVRAIARDIAKMCGTVATVDMIRRVRTGGFTLKNALKLDFLENLGNNGVDIGKYLMPADFGLADIPVLNLSHDATGRYRHGAALQTNAEPGLVRVYDGEHFVGIGTVADGVLRPKRTL